MRIGVFYLSLQPPPPNEERTLDKSSRRSMIMLPGGGTAFIRVQEIIVPHPGGSADKFNDLLDNAFFQAEPQEGEKVMNAHYIEEA